MGAYSDYELGRIQLRILGISYWASVYENI